VSQSKGRRPRASYTDGIAAKKSLGQHFLTDRSAVRRIVAAVTGREDLTPADATPLHIVERGLRSDVVPKDRVVVEVGPGHGVLTGPLAATGGKLIAVEVDDTLAYYHVRALLCNWSSKSSNRMRLTERSRAHRVYSRSAME
jgi:hypothetical protein